MATQVVKLDVGGEAGEILVSVLSPAVRMPVVNATGGTIVVAGQAQLNSAGTAQQLPYYVTANGVVITANPGNLGVITIGGPTVSNDISGLGNGVRLPPGQSYVYKIANTNAVWFNGTVTSDSIDFGGN
jgi:hypothetical protein